ncbi:MAG: glycosyltransferase [Clostridiales bacterium]|nr:glycosyltransferase [Clostridiales bacterium]
MAEVLLSIIVPVYNAARYLRDCLDSIYAQRLPEENYELICINDGSSDSSADILDEYAACHKNIRVFHQKNAGVSAARNVGLERAAGKYVWFVDSDDFIAAGILDDIALYLQNNDCDQLAVLPAQFNDGEPVSCFSEISADNYSEKVRDYLITRVLRNQCIRRIGLRFDPRITYQEDNVFYTTLFPHLKKKDLFTERIGYYYRIRQGSLSRGGTANDRILASYIAGAEDMKRLHEADGSNYNGYAYVLYMFMTTVMQMIAAEPESYKDYYSQVKQKRLFPLKFDKRYTVNYFKSGDRFFRKIKKQIRSLSYTRAGYFLLSVLHKIHVF